MFRKLGLTTDFAVGMGLVVCLLVAIVTGGGSAELQTTLGSGLIGFLARGYTNEPRDPNTRTRKTDVLEGSK